MRLTKGFDYGARGTIYLAKQPTNSVVLVGEIARQENLPESYLAKIFQDLSKKGIVRSHRGAKGGFSLAKPAQDITLLEIMEAIEGPLALSRCLTPNEGCDRIASCALYPILCQAQEQVLVTLGGTTLHQVAVRELSMAEDGN